MAEKKEGKGKKKKKPKPSKMGSVMDDLCTRFILNCPPEDLQGGERILFQVETAWWFYEDNYREKDQSLPQFKLYGFADLMFQHCPLLQPLHSELPRLMKAFNDYRWSVPVCGCIMLNDAMDKVLLVKGWSEWSNWTFPKGKIARDEEKLPCAVREVIEETSYDCGPLVNEEDFIDMKINGKQDVRLYIAHGVPMDFPFAPHTKGEISKIEWVKIKELKELKEGKGVKPGRFDVTKTYAVTPFIPKLKQWIKMNENKATVPTGVVRAGAYDVSSLEQQHEVVMAPPGAMDVAELERRQTASLSGGSVVPGAFEVSALESGASSPTTAVNVESLESQWTSNPVDQAAGEGLSEAPKDNKEKRGKKGNGESDSSAQAAAVAATAGQTGSEKKGRKRGKGGRGKKAPQPEQQHQAPVVKVLQRPIKTAAQLGGAAAAAGGGVRDGAADAAAATWQQRDSVKRTGNPFLDWRLPPGQAGDVAEEAVMSSGILNVADLERIQQTSELEREEGGPAHSFTTTGQRCVAIDVCELERRASTGSMPASDARAGVFDVAELERREPGGAFDGGGTATAVRVGAFDLSAVESEVSAAGRNDAFRGGGGSFEAGKVFDVAELERGRAGERGRDASMAVCGRVVGGAFDASGLEAGIRGQDFDVCELERRASTGSMPASDARAGVFDVAELERREPGGAFDGGGTATAVRVGAFDLSAVEQGVIADALRV